MKSLLSINSYHYLRGGSEAVYFNHAALFAEHGWRTPFFSMHHPENIPCLEEGYFADCIDYAGAGGAGRNLGNALKIIYSLEAKAKLARLLDQKPVDVAHVHSLYHHLSPSVLVELKQRGIPTVMTAHDLKIACPNNKMLNHTGVCERCKGGRVWNVVAHKCIKESTLASAVIAVESAAHKALNLYGRHLDRIIAPSRFYRDKLIEWGWPPAQIVHIPNFVEAPKAAREALSPPGDHLLYFGRLAPEKGLRTLIAAAARANVSVRVAGTGPQETELHQLGDELGSPVAFLGFLSGEALWDQVAAARAIVLPSEWYENGPMSVIEAFARGKPLLGARIGGIPELIIEGETGWSFTSGDTEDLSDKLRLVAATPATQLAAMARATRVFVDEHHGRERYYERMTTLYGQLSLAKTASAKFK